MPSCGAIVVGVLAAACALPKTQALSQDYNPLWRRRHEGQVFNRTEGMPACFNDILKSNAILPGARPGGVGCPAFFYWYNLRQTGPLRKCYDRYLEDDEYHKFVASGEDSQHAGPLYLARELPSHPCVTQDASKADYFLVPPFLPQWNKNFDDRDFECQYEVLHFLKDREEYQESVATGHDNFVVLNWWKGRDKSNAMSSAFPNAIFVGKDCGSEPCAEPYSAWPYFDNALGVFEAHDYPFDPPPQRDVLVAGVWGNSKVANRQQQPLQSLLSRSPDGVYASPGKNGDSGAHTFDIFRHSKFCVNPRGDSLSRRSLSTCILAGSIPVLLGSNLSKPFEHILDYEQFSVELPQSTSAEDVLGKLRRMPPDLVEKLHKNTECVHKAFLYDGRAQGRAVERGSMLDFLLADIVRAGELAEVRRISERKRPAKKSVW